MPVVKHADILDRGQLADHVASIWPDEYAVEVGVHRGEYARRILEKWTGKLFLVDSYREVGPDYPDRGLDGERKDHLWEVANGIGRDPRCMLMVTDSEKASIILRDMGLAFVYIDAEHTYEAVKRDIDAWWPTLRSVGILAGHDYEDYHAGVKQAVDEFAAEYDKTVYITGDSPPSWFYYK